MSRRFSSYSRDHSIGLMLLLLLIVLVPSVCLLWFMNRAVQNERIAVQQKLLEAYRGYLTLGREQLDAYIEGRIREFDKHPEATPATAVFAWTVENDAADAIVYSAANGQIVYPDAEPAVRHERVDPRWLEAQRLEKVDPAAGAEAFARLAESASSTSLRARAFYARARCLIRAGNVDAALVVLREDVAGKGYYGERSPGENLMIAGLLKDVRPAESRFFAEIARDHALDYREPRLRSSQRRFLMRELWRLFPGEMEFPTLAAETLASEYLAANPELSREPVLKPTALPGVWAVGSPKGRGVLLYRTDQLKRRLQSVLAPGLSDEVKIEFLAPGELPEAAVALQPAGEKFPGWRLSLALKDPTFFDAAGRQRATLYLWAGVLVVGTVVVLALLASHLVRRQLAVTRLKNDLVANVSHELKTPLSSMRLLVETLLNSDKLEETTTREYLELIARENLRLSRLIESFLTFSRLERDKYVFDFKEVGAGSIADKAAAAVRERFNAPGCRLDVSVAPDLPMIRADADALVTALVNLLDNAWKYSGDQKEITLSAARQNGSVVYSVSDNGIGLSPRETRRIFKRFYQVDQRLSRSSSGVGLGLSIVKMIVTAHRGDVRVQSEPGRGSTFEVSLPAASGESHP